MALMSKSPWAGNGCSVPDLEARISHRHEAGRPGTSKTHEKGEVWSLELEFGIASVRPRISLFDTYYCTVLYASLHHCQSLLRLRASAFV